MRTPHKFALTLALITFASILSFLVVAVRAQVACTPPPTVGKAAAWKQGATVNVMIDPTVHNQHRRRVFLATAFLLLRNTTNRKMGGMAMAPLMAATRSTHSCVCGKT